MSSLSSIAALLMLPMAADSKPGSVQCGLRVPPGFEVVEFSDDKQAADIYCLTVDDKGRVLVSGRGYLRFLLDDNHAGKAARVVEFAKTPKDGAMGLFWEGSSLYVTGDGGLRRFREGPNGQADGPSELLFKLQTGGEHSAHAIERGPDGWLYVLCGNSTGIDRSCARSPLSPIREPIAGGVLRFSPDFKTSEIVADGLRNAYGMDFNGDGELLTFDSDNERCVALPWYEPVRLYHIQEGGHCGWLAPQVAPWWRLPPYSVDVVAPIATLGRGSPTGVVCYKHVQFPAHYRGGFFLLDWTFGKIWFVTLERSGASYTARAELFLESVGDNGFAPTAAAVDPTTGDLYVSIGGRGTRGAVYRIRYPAGVRPFAASEVAALQPRPRSIDWQSELLKNLPIAAESTSPLERFHALRLLQRHAAHFEAGVLANAIRANWACSDRSVRRAAAELIGSLPPEQRLALAADAKSPAAEVALGLATYRDAPADVARRAAHILSDKAVSTELRLDAARLLQLAAGGVIAKASRGTVLAGYTPRVASIDRAIAEEISTAIRAIFPTGDETLDRECARLLAIIGDDHVDLLGRVAAKLTADSDPVADFHYLIVLARMPCSRSEAVTARVANALLSLDAKLTQRHLNRDTNWPLRLGEVYDILARNDRKLYDVILNNPEFGRAENAQFALAPDFDRRRAARIFLDRARLTSGYPWNPGVIELIGTADDSRGIPLLRLIWGKAGQDAAILPILARHPEAVDRDKFIAGLNSPQPATVGVCLDAMEKLGGRYEGPAILTLIRALGRISDAPEQTSLRERLLNSLRRETGQDLAAMDRAAREKWFARTYPALATRLSGLDGVDVRAWEARLTKVDWAAGDATRGQAVFVQASCASCHSGSRALGPDLAGVGTRFSRDDLFTAILQPSRDISPRYRSTVLATDDGKLYQGLIVYDATDGVILQTGPGTTVRIGGSQIASRRVSDISLMPAGLLDKLADRDLADLYAYLRRPAGTPQR
jgi:putative heme-binding domain-containing protein